MPSYTEQLSSNHEKFDNNLPLTNKSQNPEKRARNTKQRQTKHNVTIIGDLNAEYITKDSYKVKPTLMVFTLIVKKNSLNRTLIVRKNSLNRTLIGLVVSNYLYLGTCSLLTSCHGTSMCGYFEPWL